MSTRHRLRIWAALSISLVLADVLLWCWPGRAAIPPMTPFEVDKEYANALRERVQRVKSAIGPFEIAFTDLELTSYLVALAWSGAGEFPARDIKLQFNQGDLEIWATFIEVAPADLPVYVRATAEAVGGNLVFHIHQANLGPISLPGALRDLIADSLGETLAELNLPLTVEAVELHPGQAILRGTITGPIPDLPMYLSD